MNYILEPEPDNSALKEAFNEFDGPYDLYRHIYKSTECGATVGFTFTFETPDNGEWGPGAVGGEWVSETVYCDELRKYGSWADLDEHGILVSGIEVSSIVEGVDYGTENIVLDIESDWLAWDADRIQKEFYNAVDDTERDARYIWMDTHGCETCEKHWKWLYNSIDEWDSIPVWTECPGCHGDGAII